MDNNNFIIINIYYHKVDDYIEYFSVFEKTNKENIVIEFIELNNTDLYKLIKKGLEYVIKNKITNNLKCDIKIKINIPEEIRANDVYYTVSDIYNKIINKYAKINRHYPYLYIEVEDKINMQKFDCRAL